MKNLSAEMARHGVSNVTLQNVMGCSLKTVNNKLNESTEFTIGEAFRIRDALFPGLRLEYLFQCDQPPVPCAPSTSQEAAT